MGNKLPVFKPVKRLQRDKRYSNAQELTADDSASQHGAGEHHSPQHAPRDELQHAPVESQRERNALAHNNSHGGLVTMSKLRKWLLIISMLLLLISIVFIILVLIAQIKPSVLPSTYFIKIDLTHIFVSAGMPSDVPFLNSVARSIGLHDYYQVGLWTYCSGYNDENGGNPGYCSKPVPLYWVNPVQIILSELLSGATIQLPGEIVDILDLIKLASNAMFGFFIVGIALTALYTLLLPLSLLRRQNLRPKTRSCWVGFSLGTIGFFACLFAIAASTVATVMFFIMANVLGSQPELNIKAEVGSSMLAFMWIGSGALLISWLLQSRCGCCCVKVRRESRERSGRRYGGVHQGAAGVGEKSSSNSRVGSLRERRGSTEMV